MQVFSVALLLRALAVVGYPRFLGVPPLIDFLCGREPEPTPEAQGPPPDAHGRPTLSGPFRAIRHPDNLFFPLFLWALPRMSVNRFTPGGALHALRRPGFLARGRPLGQSLRSGFHPLSALRPAFRAPFPSAITVMIFVGPHL